jgi:hypothetical protein
LLLEPLHQPSSSCFLVQESFEDFRGRLWAIPPLEYMGQVCCLLLRALTLLGGLAKRYGIAGRSTEWRGRKKHSRVFGIGGGRQKTKRGLGCCKGLANSGKVG